MPYKKSDNHIKITCLWCRTVFHACGTVNRKFCGVAECSQFYYKKLRAINGLYTFSDTKKLKDIELAKLESQGFRYALPERNP